MLKNSLKAKKLILVALIAVFAAQNARAEKDGFFFGAAFPIAGIGTTKIEYPGYNYYNGGYYLENEVETQSYFSFVNLIFGYTHALGERLGLRYYGSFSFVVPITFNVDFANVDALYTLIKGRNVELRAFAGVWLGWESYYGKSYGYYYGYNSGLDLGINTGLRLVLGQRHGLEVYGRFGFLSQSKEYDTYGIKIGSWKISQPYLIGVRYTISF